MTWNALLAVPLVVAAVATPALAQDAPSLYARSLAATCASCHGTEGRAADGSGIGSLAGLQAAYIVQQMKAFQSGSRSATVMHQLSKGYSDAQIAQIAAYFAAQPR